ncbi:uncharacterized protein LOC111411260 [Olea europaea var. sylvestris]|uniref:uncharacterized protein LOC111411260 n=1 Tax=Olea europaea var. sylvestris TaxID=158386 RepID=UPI000C1D416F|nr:uncharacterized protein LOC111411260 [Olea europaea var. sylvestris]
MEFGSKRKDFGIWFCQFKSIQLLVHLQVNLCFMLPAEVIPTTTGLFPSQHKYIYDILAKANVLGSKEMSTPLSTTIALTLIEGTSIVDSNEFRSVIGVLHYKKTPKILETGTRLKHFISTKLLCDNLAAAQLSLNPVQYSRMKHIQIDLHFLRDIVQKVVLKVHHVNTQEQLADLLTKPLSKQRTSQLRTKIGIADGSPILRGRIKDHGTNQAIDHNKDN